MNEQYYALTLDDYSLPSIASGDKPYFGTLSEISTFINSIKNNKEQAENHQGLIKAFDKFCAGKKDVTHIVAYNHQQLLKSIKLIATFEYEMKAYEWNHKNVYGFTYCMKFKDARIKHFWFKYENKFLRCIKADMTDLQYRNTKGAWIPLEGGYWGFPNIIMFEPPHTYSQLAVKEKVFNTIEELKTDDENFEPGIDINFTEFCNDIFGNG